MIIYNVTINIEESSEYEWLLWMQKHHIPRVMKTGLFVSSKMTKVLIEEQTGGVTYSIQYSCENKKKLSDYQTIYAPKLQKEHEVKYAGKFVAFRTLLKVICEF